MTPFKFKLEGLLKLREFKEDQLKNELGVIVSRLNLAREELKKLNEEIDSAYKSQEKVLATPDSAQMARFFEYFIRGKKEHVKEKEALIYSLGKKYETKSKELAIAMGEVKVVQSFKDKKFEEFKKDYEKREYEKIEEFTIMKSKEES